MRKNWRQAEDQFSIYVEDENGKIIADVRAPGPPVPADIGDAMEYHRSRARLIAAAPEMIEALKIAYKVLDGRRLIGLDQNPLGFRDRIGAAIAKAERRS